MANPIVPNVGGPAWPADMMEPAIWRWFLAVIDWDWRDDQRLNTLLQSGEPTPHQLIPAVQSVRNGTRERKTRQAVNAAKVTGADRMVIAARTSNCFGVLDVNKFNADRIAGREEVMTRKVLARQKQSRREVLQESGALAFGLLSSRQIERLVDELKDYAKRWPDI